MRGNIYSYSILQQFPQCSRCRTLLKGGSLTIEVVIHYVVF